MSSNWMNAATPVGCPIVSPGGERSGSTWEAASTIAPPASLDRGDEKYNRNLSKRRAESARKYLIEVHGISPDRLETAGFGSDHPKDGEKTTEARKRNRRVVLEMVE